MNEMRIQLRALLVVMAVGVFLTGCAAMQESDVTSTEQMLAAAGFTIQLADTPAKRDHLQTLTQDKLVIHEKSGAVYYIYADAKYCKCLYSGDEANYQSYQKMSIKQNIAEMNEAAEMNWGLWAGPRW